MESDTRQDQLQPELPAGKAQDKAQGGLWWMLGCCALNIALLRVLWELL